MKCRKKIKQIICLMLCLAICITQMGFIGEKKSITADSTNDTEENNITNESDITSYYQDNHICIYNYEQLRLIGTNQIVHSGDINGDVGNGDIIQKNSANLVYRLDAEYYLMNDIALLGNQWNLPSNFVGKIESNADSKTKDLYDKTTDTIYVYNRYQLNLINSTNSSNELVTSGDCKAENVGIGEIILDANGNKLTYSSSHNYVIANSFTSDLPAMTVASLMTLTSEGNQAEGRDFPGQVIKEIGDTEYILIGNSAQLQQIGKDTNVNGAVYRAMRKTVFSSWEVDKDANGNNIMLYGGDADLLQSQNGTKDYSFGKMDNVPGTLLGLVNKYQQCAVNQTTGEIDPNLSIDSTGHKYSNTEKYIIFRDIDLKGVNWTPLMFSGTMLGGKAVGTDKLWNSDSTALNSNLKRPVISNINVVQDDSIEVTSYMGIGFFGTITNTVNKDDVGLSGGTVKVSNIKLEKASISNNTDQAKVDKTVVSSLLSTLGGLLGWLLDELTKLITFGQVELNLSETLSSMLNARAGDPTTFATGVFAGRVVGDVVIENCAVNDSTVSNINGRTGGFIGYCEGITIYDGLSKVLGGTTGTLSSLLNIVPGLGLGDLITILLKNGLDVGSLLPTGYINPVIDNCEVVGISGTLGSTTTDFNGGFVGQQVGTIIKNCQIIDSAYEVQAKNYAGGFSGVCRDAEIKGTLSSIGIELLRVMKPQSIIINSNLKDTQLTVTGGNYLGGFIGGQANSYAINDSITGSVSIKGTGDNAGGFSGYATVGWINNLGKNDVGSSSLLTNVSDLLIKLLSDNSEGAQELLSLVGIAPSAIMGCQMNCSSLEVAIDGSNAGGILGHGDGVYLCESSTDKLNNLSFWKYHQDGSNGFITNKQGVSLTGLKSVTAKKNYAGGIAGSVGVASVGGLLNNTLGLGGYLGFTISSVNVQGMNEGYVVKANENYAGGAFGEAAGGNIDKVSLNLIKEVTANNRVGGFAGTTGPGDLAGASGLSLNLLGLNNLLTVKNLLSVGQGVAVTINDTSISGVETGFTVKATGSNAASEVIEYCAAGFIGKSHSTQANNCHVENLLSVQANKTDGIAGGFVGTSLSGGLAEVSDETEIKSLINAGNLLTAVGYLIPKYTDCDVSYVVDKGFVEAAVAGGFAGDFRSGTVNNHNEAGDYAVYNIDHVTGSSYAGGFGGKVYSGGLASSTGGISILGGLTSVSINITDLLSLIDAYVPYIQYAGVKSDNGFVVKATQSNSDDLASGSAGGFIGYGSGVQVSYCNITNLKHTTVTPPTQLEAIDGSSYFNDSSQYAIDGARYAGGYIGNMDIGAAASIGSGLKILGQSISLNNILDALSVVVSTIEHSDVIGNAGGFAVRATDKDSDGAIGKAGGFAGSITGGQIQDANAYNFSYVIGQVASGGYVGDFKPGNVASVLGDAGILGGLVNTQETLASLAESFVPTIRNSSTTCIPCGGAVRAQGVSDNKIQRGMAGGYVGHNEGGHIWGLNTAPWKKENTNGTSGTYIGETSTCEALRILSVYGSELAGGYTGLMESADTAATGSLSLLWGLVKVDNLLGALNIVYPTEENTAVYGPLAKMDFETWNKWVKYVGVYGGYGSELAQNGTVESQDQLNAILDKYVYGYSVVAGRESYELGANTSQGGVAGGYVGAMHSGVITNGQAYETKSVQAMKSAGGFVGEMLNNGAANLGSVNLLGLKLDLGKLVNVLDVFVPVIKVSSVKGYQSGLTVNAAGLDLENNCGYAGGYVGWCVGGKIWSDDTKAAYNASGGCNATNLKRIKGTNCIGGYVGLATAGSVASANTNASDGLLQGILNSLITTPGDLASVLEATVSTIRKAKTSAADSAWGYSVEGDYSVKGKTKYAKSAGGFAGSLEATIVGERNGTTEISVEGLRGVNGGLYAGGFFGLGDVTSVASVSGNNTSSTSTSILDLIKLGEVSVLDAFRTYIYSAKVVGVSDGITIKVNEQDQEGILSSARYTGNAGGFGGGLLNGSVKNSSVTNLSSVTGLNYCGGFIGHLGKNGTVDVDNASVLDKLNLLGATAGVLDVWGSHVDNCSVDGIAAGYIVKVATGSEQTAGGFVGYSDLSKIDTCTVDHLKLIKSEEIAGGFVGETKMNYVANAQIDSKLLNALLVIINGLVKALYLDKLENLGLIDLGLGDLLNLKILSDGDLLYVNLLGLKISASLSKADAEYGGATDAVIVTIGDSTIKLPCNKDGVIGDDGKITPQLELTLIKGNRSNIVSSKVKGIDQGYDVFGGGANDADDGTNKDGYSGGFIGLNNEGVFENNTMTYCDVVRGTENLIGPFTGKTNLKSTYAFDTVPSIEGTGNKYSIYRTFNEQYQKALNSAHSLISNMIKDDGTATIYNRYDVLHYNTIGEYIDLKDAVMAEDDQGKNAVDLAVYKSPAKAVLMSDTKVSDTNDALTPEPGDMQNPCDSKINLTIQKIWKDWFNIANLRPDTITVTIYQSYTKDNEKVTVQYQDPITLSANEDGSMWSSTWKKVITDLPVAFESEDGTIYYYSYTVEETAVDGYTTTIEYDNTGYVATITNSHYIPLPDTGGKGIYSLVLIGGTIIALLAINDVRKKKNRKGVKRS